MEPDDPIGVNAIPCPVCGDAKHPLDLVHHMRKHMPVKRNVTCHFTINPESDQSPIVSTWECACGLKTFSEITLLDHFTAHDFLDTHREHIVLAALREM